MDSAGGGGSGSGSLVGNSDTSVVWREEARKHAQASLRSEEEGLLVKAIEAKSPCCAAMP